MNTHAQTRRLAQSAWRNEILRQLDQGAQDATLPTFWNENFPCASMRLTVFRDAQAWLILFEKIAYGVYESVFLNMIYAFGNKIPNPGYQSALDILSATDRTPIWDDNGKFILDIWNFEIMVNGVARTFAVTPQDYARAKLDPTDDMLPELRMLRLITHLLPGEFFATDRDMLKACNRANLARFMQFTAWHHPNIYEGELPSHTACFQSLAQAIAENDAHLCNCSDSINSRWDCWED